MRKKNKHYKLYSNIQYIYIYTTFCNAQVNIVNLFEFLMCLYLSTANILLYELDFLTNVCLHLWS